MPYTIFNVTAYACVLSDTFSLQEDITARKSEKFTYSLITTPKSGADSGGLTLLVSLIIGPHDSGENTSIVKTLIQIPYLMQSRALFN